MSATLAPGLTLDTGALIALERRRQRMLTLLRGAEASGLTVTAPANVIAEWWRKRSRLAEQILAAIEVEPMDEELAVLVGETLAAVRGATLVDANVIVSAARRGDIVLTSDVEDFRPLSSRFPGVRVLQV